jgi:hypothetical protein
VVISPTGKQLLPCEYTEIKEVEKFLLCKKDDKWGLFTRNAKELYPCQYQDINLDRIGGKLCLFTQQKGLWGLTDFRTGKELLPSNFSKMEAFGTNDEYIKTIKDNKVGLYTGRGVLLFPCEFTNIKIITIPLFINDRTDIKNVSKEHCTYVHRYIDNKNRRQPFCLKEQHAADS